MLFIHADKKWTGVVHKRTDDGFVNRMSNMPWNHAPEFAKDVKSPSTGDTKFFHVSIASEFIVDVETKKSQRRDAVYDKRETTNSIATSDQKAFRFGGVEKQSVVLTPFHGIHDLRVHFVTNIRRRARIKRNNERNIIGVLKN